MYIRDSSIAYYNIMFLRYYLIIKKYLLAWKKIREI